MGPYFLQALGPGLHGDSNQVPPAERGHSVDHDGPSRLFDRVVKKEVSTPHGLEAGGSQLLPFVSTFSRAIIPFHRTIKNNFSVLTTRCPSFGRYRLLSAYRKNFNLQSVSLS